MLRLVDFKKKIINRLLKLGQSTQVFTLGYISIFDVFSRLTYIFILSFISPIKSINSMTFFNPSLRILLIRTQHC